MKRNLTLTLSLKRRGDEISVLANPPKAGLT
jgi:hypothetical protein